MRILHYGLSRNRGGIETFLMQLAENIVPEFQFDFVYNNAGGPPFFHDELAEMGCRFHGVTPRRVSPRRNAADLVELFQTEQFDIVHCHLNTLSYVEPIRAALRTGCPVIVHSHSAGAPRNPTTRFLHELNSSRFPRDHVEMVAVSQAAGAWLFGKSATFKVIPNGIDVKSFAFDPPARDQLRADLELGDSFVVGHVGAFLPAKNHAFLLRVFREVTLLRPDARLLLVGAGPLEAAARGQAEALGIGDRVRFLGNRGDIGALLSAMDCLLFPSRYEGFGLAVLEAQASGLPAVVSDGVPPEALVSRNCESLPLHASPGQWAKAVLAVTPAEDRSVGAERVANAGFSADAVTARIADIYRTRH